MKIMGESIQKGLKSGDRTTQCCVMSPITLFKHRLVDFLTITHDIKIAFFSQTMLSKLKFNFKHLCSSITEMKPLVPV